MTTRHSFGILLFSTTQKNRPKFEKCTIIDRLQLIGEFWHKKPALIHSTTLVNNFLETVYAYWLVGAVTWRSSAMLRTELIFVITDESPLS